MESPFSQSSDPGTLIGSPNASFEEPLQTVSPVEGAACPASAGRGASRPVGVASPDHLEVSRPGYHPRTVPIHQERSIYNRLHADPRLYFLGAPSRYQRQFPSSLVRSVRHEVIGSRIVPVVTWRPSGVSAIERTERVEIEDTETGTATIYTLASVWRFDRTYGVQRSVRTQTPRAWARSSSQTSTSTSSSTSTSTHSDAATNTEVETAEMGVQARDWY